MRTNRARLVPTSLLVAGAALLATLSHAVSAPDSYKHGGIHETSGNGLAVESDAPKASFPGRLSAPQRFQRSAADTRLAYSPAATSPATDIGALKEAIRLARRGKAGAATDIRNQIHDGAGRKLVEWVILRSDDDATSFVTYAGFIRANPRWPGVNAFRRRAEARLWSERREPTAVLAHFSNQEPLGALGKLAMARAQLARGDRAAARKYVRSAWRENDFSTHLEAQVLETFGQLLTKADHKARMDTRLYADDLDTAMRAARRLGASDVAIVKARIAVNHKAKNARGLLDAVPKAGRNDPGYLFTRIQWLRRNDQIGEAAQLMLSAPHDRRLIHDADAWWIERRILVRKLLDDGRAQSAYRIARDAALPSKESLRVDQPFTAGWIALRFLHDHHAAGRHFDRISQITTHPTSLARAGYWLGRVAEAAGRDNEARRHYEEAARHSSAYYGQLAGARLGRRSIPVRRPPALSRKQRADQRSLELVRAVELLYLTGNRDLVLPFVNDLNRIEIDALTLIAETIAKHKDARGMLAIGRGALARGFAFDHYAFPLIGLPKYNPIGPKADKSLVYAIARAESAFNPNVISIAKAIGLMQVTPATGHTIARRLGIKFDSKRLLKDPSYNVQLGSAELADLVKVYDGNHVLAFVGYNAGRGRVKEWIARYGDPRDPSVDVVDWVERIPFTETRIYVQRVMENLQVYRARFGEPARLTIEADMRGAPG